MATVLSEAPATHRSKREGSRSRSPNREGMKRQCWKKIAEQAAGKDEKEQQVADYKYSEYVMSNHVKLKRHECLYSGLISLNIDRARALTEVTIVMAVPIRCEGNVAQDCVRRPSCYAGRPNPPISTSAAWIRARSSKGGWLEPSNSSGNAITAPIVNTFFTQLRADYPDRVQTIASDAWSNFENYEAKGALPIVNENGVLLQEDHHWFLLYFDLERGVVELTDLLYKDESCDQYRRMIKDAVKRISKLTSNTEREWYQRYSVVGYPARGRHQGHEAFTCALASVLVQKKSWIVRQSEMQDWRDRIFATMFNDISHSD
ncbi:unnamed protein product, partial [Mesorhabditis spiculigera]